MKVEIHEVSDPTMVSYALWSVYIETRSKFEIVSELSYILGSSSENESSRYYIRYDGVASSVQDEDDNYVAIINAKKINSDLIAIEIIR